jgi:hypothetical protein
MMFDDMLDIYVWPDGTWCDKSELCHFMAHGWSDDYLMVSYNPCLITPDDAAARAVVDMDERLAEAI